MIVSRWVVAGNGAFPATTRGHPSGEFPRDGDAGSIDIGHRRDGGEAGVPHVDSEQRRAAIERLTLDADLAKDGGSGSLLVTALED